MKIFSKVPKYTTYICILLVLFSLVVDGRKTRKRKILKNDHIRIANKTYFFINLTEMNYLHLLSVSLGNDIVKKILKILTEPESFKLTHRSHVTF